MKLLDKEITILKSLNPITVLDVPNKKTIEYLGRLVNDQKLIDFVKILRLQTNFPKEGIPIEEFVGRSIAELPIVTNQLVLYAFENAAHELSKNMGISDEFNTNILLLVFFNAFIDVDYFEGFITDPIKFLVGRKNISSAMFDYNYDVAAIVIPFNMSQRTLLKWIKDKKNWSDIQKQMDENLSSDPFSTRLHKNTEYAIEIMDLKDNKGLTFGQVTDEMNKRYPDDERFTNENGIKKLYYDYKQILSSLDPHHKEK